MGRSEKTIEQEASISKEEAIDILDRIIGFISSCDNKASIVLGTLGVILSIMLLSDEIKYLSSAIRTASQTRGFFDVFFILMLMLTVILIAYGIYRLLNVLIARTANKVHDSKIFCFDSLLYFNEIAKNETYEIYKEKLLKYNKADLLNDVISQIYINSIICKRKYENYNIGTKISMIGLAGFILLWVAGFIIY